jgi:hypothetical protein
MLRSFVCLVALAAALLTIQHSVGAQEVIPDKAQATDPQADAVRVEALETAGIEAIQRDRTLWLVLEPSAVERQRISIPRLCGTIRSLGWRAHPEVPLEFAPEPNTWVFSWASAPNDAPVIEIVFETLPILPALSPATEATADGSVMLHAFRATTFGEKLRFEPQWYKNTVGYWTVATDYASWDLVIDQPGTFAVAVLQGCGAGQGGSDAVITLRKGERVTAERPFQTIDTGHFQNFRWNDLGTIQISEPGTYELRIAARRIADTALFDVRAVHLVRQATETP